MNYFASTETYRIPLAPFDGSDEWVDIKDELTDKDERACFVAAAQAGARIIDRGDGTMAIDATDAAGAAGAVAFAENLLQRCIVGWSFVHARSHQPVAVTPATIGLLKGVSTFIAQAATEHYNGQRLTPEVQKNSSGPPSPPTSTVAPFPTNLEDSSSDGGSASIPTPRSPSAAVSVLR